MTDSSAMNYREQVFNRYVQSKSRLTKDFQITCEQQLRGGREYTILRTSEGMLLDRYFVDDMAQESIYVDYFDQMLNNHLSKVCQKEVCKSLDHMNKDFNNKQTYDCYDEFYLIPTDYINDGAIMVSYNTYAKLRKRCLINTEPNEKYIGLNPFRSNPNEGLYINVDSKP